MAAYEQGAAYCRALARNFLAAGEAVERLKLPEIFRKNTMIFIITILVAVSIMAAGTFAWLSLVQRITNDFEYEPDGIRLIKRDSKTDELLPGAVFKLYDSYGNHVIRDGTGNDISNGITSDENGEIKVNGLTGDWYYFVEVSPPDGYKIQVPGEKHYVQTGGEITVKNIPMTASLTIKKAIAAKDLAGDAVADNDKKDPFQFMVIIGDDEGDKNKTYRYTIYDKDGTPIVTYTHTTVSGDVVTITSGGTIKSGETFWLRDGHYAVIQDVTVADYYIVTEENTPEIELHDLDVIRNTHFDCDNPNSEHKHEEVIGSYKGSPWASFSDNSSGYIGESGSVAQFTNIFIPPDYQEVTISSLVVIDRIVDQYRDPNELDYLRRKADEEKVDFAQPFEVKITIGSEKRQRYYYEVVYIIDEEHRPQITGNNHEHTLDYYHANDPHPELNHYFSPMRSARVAPANARPLAAGLFSIAPPNAPVRSNPDPFAPLHKPSDFERWGGETGRNYGEGTLKESDGNEIVVDLHHQAAVIIYGIPTLTEYTAEQIELFNNGYIHHSNYMTKGVILPDLDRVNDPNYEEYTNFFGPPASMFSPFDAATGADTISAPATLLRTRSDIFNYFPSERDLELEKIWDDDNNLNGKRTASVIATVTGTVSGNRISEKEVVLSSPDWKATLKVPEFYSDGVTPITYSVTERRVSGYRPPVIDEPASGYFTITNTYDDTTTPDPGGSGGGPGSLTGEADLTVTKTVNGNGADRYKKFDFTVKIGRYTYRIKLSHGQRYVFTDIPAGTAYSVSEASYSSEGYSTSATGTSGTIKSGGNTAAFVNTKGAVTQSSPGTLTITKSVSGWFVDTTRKFRFVAQIGGTKHEVFLKHGESSTFVGIPAGTAYTVTEDDYSSAGYVTSSTGATGTVGAAGATAAFVNEYVGEAWPKPDDGAVQISGKKTWVHGENTSRPESITVFVMNGSTIVAQKTVTAKEDWKYAFNLPKYGKDGKEIIYSINEDTVKDYFKTIKGYDLENVYNPTQNPGTGDMKVIWIWFIAMMAASIGLRAAVFYRKQRKGKA